MAVYYVVSAGVWRNSRRGRVKTARRTAFNSLRHTVSSAIKQKEKSSAQIHKVEIELSFRYAAFGRWRGWPVVFHGDWVRVSLDIGNIVKLCCSSIVLRPTLRIPVDV
jgi:hypothetical protein